MLSTQEQFLAATKAHFDAQIQVITSLTSKAFEGVEKVIDLNVAAVKSSMQELSESGKGLGAAKDPQAFIAAVTATIQPAADKALEYGRQLTEITNSLQPHITKAAEDQLAQSRQKLQDILALAATNAPAGSENAVAALQSILSNADSSFDQLIQTTRKAVETLQHNVQQAAAPLAAKAGAKTSKK